MALGEPYEGKLHVRFDEGVLETETTVRSSGTLARKGRNGLGLHDLPRPPRQRPTLQLENLRTHCPRHAQAEMKRDYHRLLYAADGLAARAAYDAFVKKWSALCPAVAKSLEEAGLELLTFYDFPKAMWKSLRTTNTVENLNREFRRRTKTQASFSTEDAALIVLYGLVAFGHIQLRKIDGHQQLPAFLAKEWQKVA